MTPDLATIALIGWGAILAVQGTTLLLALAQPKLRRRAPHRADTPPVSVVLPVHGPVPVLEEGMVSVFTQDHPAFEVLIAAQKADPAVIALAQRIMARYPAVPARIVRGDDDFAVSPKVNNMAEAFRQAAHDVIVVKDDTMIMEEGQITALVSELVDGVGVAVATPLVHEAEGLAGEIERAYINGHSGRWLMAGSALGQGFGIGKLFALRQSDLARAGGFAAIAHTIAEDHAMTKAFARIGLPTVMAEGTGRQVLGPRSLKQVFDRLVRWAVCRRLEEPASNLGEALTSPLLALLLSLLAAPTLGKTPLDLAGFTLVFVMLCDVLFDKVKGIRVTPLSVLASPLRDLMLPVVLLKAHCVRQVNWGGEARVLRDPRKGPDA